jgi:hypothetical protein
MFMFLAIVISGFVAGAILGLRFRVFVLGPAILFAAIGTVAISFANGLSGGTTLVVLAVMVALQCGYVAGVPTAYLAARTSAARNSVRRRTWKPLPFY